LVNVDATEKIISILKHRLADGYRVIEPSWAKSARTIIALSSNTIVLGLNSELGPIDPQFRTPNGNIPCELIASDAGQPHHIRQMADLTVQRNRQLATDLLKNGMMKGKTDAEIADVISKISTSNSYKSHGAVIDYEEAKQKLGLSVEYLKHDDPVWRRLWLLYCMYDFDTKAKNLGKIFEGKIYSIARPK
jgi:membrane-bound ClpP family serine protease